MSAISPTVSNAVSMPYACPKTHAMLVWKNDALCSADGRARYDVHDGIPSFLTRLPIESEEDAATLERLNEIASRAGWMASLADVYGETSNIYKYVTDSSRASYLGMLPLTSDSVVLEIGPGLGQFTEALAARVQMVYALEVVAGQARFAAKRCQQKGLTNVSIACGGDDCRLPYRDQSFDLVICNLVLEWSASRDPLERPEAGQERYLAEMARVLKPGGFLYLSTKNRFALRYLLGGRDEHVHNERFGSALPRWLMRSYLSLRMRGRPQGVLHSYPMLRKMLQRAGMEPTQSFWAAPEMRYPTHFIPTDADSVRSARQLKGFCQGHSRLTMLFMPLIPASLVKYVTPGLTFLARKRS